jgi:hypothetical protein
MNIFEKIEQSKNSYDKIKIQYSKEKEQLDKNRQQVWDIIGPSPCLLQALKGPIFLSFHTKIAIGTGIGGLFIFAILAYIAANMVATLIIGIIVILLLFTINLMVETDVSMFVKERRKYKVRRHFD